jgi:hypothetical protein
MKQSEKIAILAKSLVKAQNSIESALTKNAQNESFGVSYADLGSVIKAVKNSLLAEGIVVIQSPTASELAGYVSLTTRLVHESGEWMEDTATSPMSFLDPQGFGSAISYLRRYSLAAMMGLYQTDDDAVSSTPVVRTMANTPKSNQSGNGGAPTVAEKKRLESLLQTVKNASEERLVASWPTIKASLSGDALAIVEQAVAERMQVLTAMAEIAQPLS